MPYSGGLARNIEQCLNDFDIPLMLSHTVVEIHGKERLTGVTVARVDDKRRPIEETKEFIPCDTLLLSVGLIPENELTKGAGIEMDPITSGAIVDQNRQTSIEGIFSCGNVLHVHDLVDFVSEEAEIAGKSAAEYVKGKNRVDVKIPVRTDGIIRYTVPEIITEQKDVKVYFRVGEVLRNVRIDVYRNGEKALSRKRPRIAPGEMESLLIKKDIVWGAKDIYLEVVKL
jgi:pyruvate/2-oxoglutarate dehydrogenase complex dihydrolipoamide dehydrogenase (E3) component